MSAISSLIGGKRTSRGQPISVAIDPERTSAPQRYLTRPALWHLPSVEVRLYCRILIVGGVDATAGVHRTDRYGRVEFSATGICPDKNDHAAGRVFAAV